MTVHKQVSRFIPAALALFACCAGTYSPPRIQKQVIDIQFDAKKDDLYKATLLVLRKQGYRFSFADFDEGRITTRPRTMKLTDKDCDCGTAMGMLFASDRNTSTDVSYFLIARDNQLSIRSIIQGQYVASDTSMVKRFECVSRGAIEKDLAKKIKGELAAIASEPPAETSRQ